ncbi:hypothetical protein COY13_02420 [Candidatus Roizmanbacteria bacterium CG_4_10_14_0_2_um_filter_36_35]|uniref:Uncharacterized protein n=4 Tax=Candidatus Roizmaniibacteriota TaxID=1752723 RepID=A0A2M7BWV6_9BACT|nr:MAG: hypothetical protein COV86_00240 [Candidatus Roizmanbacteria bacterium CG11_big_fil_rev_8_21_14_0_20_35_14]PIV11063.1 MAG: hypothetical protein COS50_01965 [Candidatus Roizmanbacteria bacterium CG03_land_8_20_14_0_80_35_26]PIZ67906.1 MAG: hypothetical protein COY13_02420 [Candidatus Roizmanbacteria bacterium CG_4_10_14_0_2_um_filter_36_35]PJC32788.1 MAG: hypothetical protein CO049_01810 [Candidatus Roizmanbacteria bacterium CG_4_9_14_0_2_um_filter_36_12]
MIVLLLLTLSVYLISRLTIKEIFIFFRKFFSTSPLIYIILSLIYLPGTVVHESAHFITALLLLLPVQSMSIFPSFSENEIKLGEVKFIKRDFLRGILVGIAPFFFSLTLLSAIFIYHIFPNTNLWLNILFGYLIFSISSNMFSSSKDLEGIVLLVPLIILAFIIFYVFDIRLNLYSFNNLLGKINYYLIFVLVINLFFFLVFKVINRYKR